MVSMIAPLPHPEEPALAGVSKDGTPESLIVRDAALDARLLTVRRN
jgi:hypothetical protein